MSPLEDFLVLHLSNVTISDCETLILDKDNQMNKKKNIFQMMILFINLFKPNIPYDCD